MNNYDKKEAINEAKASLEIEDLHVSKEVLDKALLEDNIKLIRNKEDESNGRRRNKME